MSWESLQPLTAHLVAARTRDPAAAVVADRVVAAMYGTESTPTVTLWRWVPAVFDLRGVPRADLDRLPNARLMDGAVVLRNTAAPLATSVWIDAGQPFLRRGQHFDAGSFLIRAGGYLVVEGGDDIEFEARHSKGGEQHLGDRGETFDFGQYATASIAHNCLLFWDAARVPHWYGRRFAPSGGQTPIEGTCTDFAAPLDAQSRQTARLLAYGNRDQAAYVALDLAPAYDPRTVEQYTREFVFLWGRVLLVVDRATTANIRAVPTSIVNIPARPTADGADLTPEARVAGSENDAGVWRCDRARRLRWTDRNGGIWFHSLLPADRSLAVVGGPARKLVIAEGPLAGRTYVGGDARSFERLILPANRSKTANAWYRLGRPTLLGPQFAVRPHWGRVEIEPNRHDGRYLFINALVIDEATAKNAPDITADAGPDGVRISIDLSDARAVLTLPATHAIGGAMRADKPTTFEWTLPEEVAVDPPLPIRGETPGK